MEKIDLSHSNRYGYTISLDKTDGKTYKLNVDDNIVYFSVSKINDSEYNYIDPEGGPILCKDSILPIYNKKYDGEKLFIEKIYNGEGCYLFDLRYE